MLRWLGEEERRAGLIPSVLRDGAVTDDPLAALEDGRAHRPIYSVSRSVFLPRVTLKNTANTSWEGAGVNPLFRDVARPHRAPPKDVLRRSPHSSGYGGSNISEPLYHDKVKLREDAVQVLDQHPTFVKSIKVATPNKPRRSLPSSGSGSSGGGTLTTIPEGRVDPIPKPIWPPDSLLDDALLLYTSLNQNQDEHLLDVSVKELLVELLNSINTTLENEGVPPEQMLRAVKEKISASIATLMVSTEEEMKKLCINLSNCRKVSSVLRAFNSSPEWSRARTISGDTEDIYQEPSVSSSGCSELNNALPVFIHEDLGSVPNGVRNAMIYGTLHRTKGPGGSKGAPQKRSSLRAPHDDKPSVWEQYYGVRAMEVGDPHAYAAKPTDVPLFPGGRPEADFTLDVPRSELLSKRMKQDKKWRCRCRLLTSFLGLVFFLLSVMAVSLMLTRGKRMFGSMM